MPNPLAFIGEPLNFKNKFKIYPAKVRDVVANDKFNMYRHIFTLSAYDIADQIRKSEGQDAQIPTPFEFLLINCYHDQQFENLVIEAFNFFTKQVITILYEQKAIVVDYINKDIIDLNDTKNLVLLTEDEYFDFQNAIRLSLGEKPEKPPEPEDPDEHPEIKRIKALSRQRERIKAKQNMKNGISLDSILVAICCMGIGITPLNIGEMSYAAIGSLMNTMQEKEKYDIDIRSLLAGADSKKIKPKYWIRNNDKE